MLHSRCCEVLTLTRDSRASFRDRLPSLCKFCVGIVSYLAALTTYTARYLNIGNGDAGKYKQLPSPSSSLSCSG